MPYRSRGLLREPLLHFLALAVVVFAVRHLLEPTPLSRVELDRTAVAALRLEHEKKRGAPPTAEEERALIEAHVEHELLYREALALGLDRGDVIVRRRLIQKMQLLLDGDDADAPGLDEARAFHRARAGERYLVPATTTLEHIFFVAGSDAEARARAAAAALAAGADAGPLGDPFIRGRRLERASDEELAAVLGFELVAALGDLAAGAWSPPLRSSYGLHLVRVVERAPGRPSTFDEVAGRVRADLERERREARRRAAIAELRSRYQVVEAAR
jgi:peptidyl-prolyl cis-trans isomerase C